MPADRIALRLSLIREEGIEELRDALQRNSTPLVIDALIDTVYVSLGTLVEMGAEADPELLRVAVQTPNPERPLRVLASRYLAANDGRLRSLKQDLHAQNERVAAYSLNVIAGRAIQVLNQAGIDATPFFDEIHRANMSKLGADGLPVRSRGWELDNAPAGKSLKGPNYVAPDVAGVYFQLYPDMTH
ncbi:hypothetical protein [Plantibacter flavus]|uniref:hypothetical protein n=1 Tax=Plantibacter flavus TaxID=150123 RepID=UPI0013564309|nr:hypothetical protein [Plantibacter flavus]